MSKRTKKRHKNKKELVVDIAKDFLMWLLVTGGSFLYWMVVLLILSLVLLNIWKVSFEALIQYAVILMVITSVAYLGRTIYRWVH